MIATDNDLIAEHRPMVVAIARKLLSHRHDLSLDDLVQAGMVGLLEAAGTYERSNPAGARFSTYAKSRVRGAMLDEINRGGRPVRIPDRYHGPAAERLTGPSAEAARAMKSRRFVGDSQREDALTLAEIAIDHHASPTIEEFEMIALAEDKAAETAEDPKRCKSCQRRYKNPSVRRCYYRDCAGARPATGERNRPGPKPKAATVAIPAITTTLPDVGDEIRVLTLLSGMTPFARDRVLAYARSAFGG